MFIGNRFRQHDGIVLLAMPAPNGISGNMPHPNGESYHCIAWPFFNDDGTVTVLAIGGAANDKHGRQLVPSVCDCHVTISADEYLKKWKQF